MEDLIKVDRPHLASRLSGVLVQSRCGFISKVGGTWTDIDEPALISATAAVNTSTGARGVEAHHRASIHGSGTGLTEEEATIPALAEAVERHAAATFYEEQFFWHTAIAAECRVLDLDTVPRCSDKEMADPHCSLSLAVKDKPIRWVKGLCLHTGEVVLVPAVMVYSHAGWRGPQERFWLPISTGCAAHGSYEDAVLTGLCEVVERDAISLVWRQLLPLPRIVLDSVGPIAAPYWELCQQANEDVEWHFFDATMDIGLPTIYALQVSHHHPHARTIVACSTSLTFDQALGKAIKDLIAFKRAFQSKRVLPTDIKAFTGLLDGACYMARPEHAAAFNFLLRSQRTVRLSQLSQGNYLPHLADALARFKALGMAVFAVDLTTDEAIRAGLRVVRVLIPGLQPLSLHTAAQFLGHPRLYTAPRSMGYEARQEERLNEWPQPFA